MIKLSILSFFIITSAFAQSYTFQHPTCKIRVPKKSKQNNAIYSLLLDKLKEKRFKTQPLIDDKKAFPGDLYSVINVERPDNMFWKKCIVSLSIKVTKDNKIKKSDQTLYKKQIQAAFPRVTPKGDERCKKALKDIFTHIPYCIKPSRN